MPRTIIRKVTRASGSINNPEMILSRMRSFAAKLRPSTPVTFLAAVTEDGLENYILTPDVGGMDEAALSATHAVSGKIQIVDDMPNLTDVGYVGHMFYRPGGSRSSSTQAGSNPFSLSGSLAEMPVGSWVAVTMRAPHTSFLLHEGRLWATWMHGQLKGNTHHSLEPNGVIAHISAGSTDRLRAASIIREVSGGMHGFDLEVKTVHFPRPHILAAYLVLAALITALGLFVPTLPAVASALPEAVNPEMVRRIGLIIATLAILPALCAVVYVAWSIRYERAFVAGRFPAPRIRWALRTRPPTTDTDHGAAESFPSPGGKKSGSKGDYPLNRSSFKLGALLPAAVLAPAAGSSSGSSETTSRTAPASLVRPIGPAIGHDDKDRLVRLSARDLWAGVSVFGKPRSGKSYFLRAIVAFLIGDQQQSDPSKRPSSADHPSMLGPRGAVVAFESKDGEDALEYMKWGRSLGARVTVFDIADVDGPRISLFDGDGDPRQQAARFVDRMSYHWGDSIGPRSAKTLRNVFTAALGFPDEAFEEALRSAAGSAPVPAPVVSPMAVAHTLLGGYDEDFALHVVEQFRLYAKEVRNGDRPGDIDQIETALGGLTELYGNAATKSNRAKLQEAPASKIEELMLAPHWWRRDGKTTTFKKILTKHAKVVINSGATSTLTGASQDDLRLPESTRDAISAMLLFSLRQSIEDYCGGWEAQGRYVAVVSDEVARVAASSPDVIKWFRMQGRSYGVIPIFATQEPDNLDPDVRSTMFSLSTVMSYAQENSDVSASIASDFTGGAESGFEVVRTKEIMDLPKYHVMVRTVVDQQRQTVFTAKVFPFEDDRSAFWDTLFPPASLELS